MSRYARKGGSLRATGKGWALWIHDSSGVAARIPGGQACASKTMSSQGTIPDPSEDFVDCQRERRETPGAHGAADAQDVIHVAYKKVRLAALALRPQLREPFEAAQAADLAPSRL